MKRDFCLESIIGSLFLVAFSMQALAQTPYPGPVDSEKIYPGPDSTPVVLLPTAGGLTTRTAYTGIATVGWGEIAFDEFIDCTPDQANRWSNTWFLSNGQTFSGWWPVGGNVQNSTSHTLNSYPPDLDTTLTCRWNNALLHDSSKGIKPTKIQLMFPLWLDLADSQDKVIVTLRGWLNSSNRTTILYERTFTRNDQNDTHIVEIDSGEMPYTLAYWQHLELQFHFQSDSSYQTTVGAMIGNVKIQVKRDTPLYSCDEWNTNATDVNRLGLNLGYRVPGTETFYIRSEDPRVLFDLQKIGINWVRFVFYPEPNDGDDPDLLYDLDYTRYDYMIKNLCDRKIGIIPVIGIESIIGVGTQQTDFLTMHGFSDLNRFLGAPETNAYSFRALFKKRLTELNQHYPDIQNWEILNEPDLVSFLTTFPGTFSEFLAIADAILTNDTIILGGLSNTWNQSGVPFLRNEYGNANTRLMFSASFDQLGVHPYTDGFGRGISPDDYFYHLDSDQNGQMLLDPLRDRMKEADLQGEKIIQITEFGFDTATPTLPEVGRRAGGHPCAIKYGTLVTEAEQAQYLHSGTELLLNYPPKTDAVDKVIWYRYDDIFYAIPAAEYDSNCGGAVNWQEERLAYLPVENSIGVSRGVENQALIQHWFGIRSFTGQEKPAYCVLQQLSGVKTACLDATTKLDYHFHLPVVLRTGRALPRTVMAESVPTVIVRQGERSDSASINSLLFLIFSMLSLMGYFVARRGK